MFDVLIPLGIVIPLLLLFALLAYLNFNGALLATLAVLPAYLLRIELFGLPTNLLELLIFVLVIFGFAKYGLKLFRQGGWVRMLAWPLLLIVLGLLTGLIVSGESRVALGIIKGWFVVPFLLAFLVHFLVQTGKLKVKNLVVALGVSSLGLSLIALFQVIGGVFVGTDSRASSLFTSPNYLSMFLVPVLFLILGWLTFAWRKRKIDFWFLLVVFVLGLSALYSSFSYGGYLALGVGLLIFLFILGVRFWILLGGIILGGGLLGFLQRTSQKFQALFDLSQYSSYSIRLEVWKTSYLMLKENWSTGVGLGAFKDCYTDFVGRAVEAPRELIVLHAHNLYLYFWLNLGLVGLVGFLWLVGRTGYELYRLVKETPHPLIAGLASSFSAILVHGLVDTTYWKYDLSILFWLLVALIFALNKEETRWV